MDWQTYEKKYIEAAKEKGKTDKFCEENLAYAKSLFDKQLPIIYTPEHFCLLVGFEQSYVYSAANAPQKFYRSFQIPKKNGKMREIREPLPNLKEIQEWILHEILEQVPISPYAKAFVKKTSVRDNARFHTGQKKVLSMDLKDFFPSIGFNRVLHVFTSLGYRRNVAVLLAKLCCLDDVLPQGAPTSPMISNIVGAVLDKKIAASIDLKEIHYTRYADDLTFSGDFDPARLISTVDSIVYGSGFRVNKEKTHVRKPNQRQEVTGIVVNEKMQVSREKRRQIRAEAHYIQKFGLDAHLNNRGITDTNYIDHIMGVCSQAMSVNPEDTRLKECFRIFQNAKKAQSLSCNVPLS